MTTKNSNKTTAVQATKYRNAGFKAWETRRKNASLAAKKSTATKSSKSKTSSTKSSTKKSTRKGGKRS